MSGNSEIRLGFRSTNLSRFGSGEAARQDSTASNPLRPFGPSRGRANPTGSERALALFVANTAPALALRDSG